MSIGSSSEAAPVRLLLRWPAANHVGDIPRSLVKNPADFFGGSGRIVVFNVGHGESSDSVLPLIEHRITDVHYAPHFVTRSHIIALAANPCKMLFQVCRDLLASQTRPLLKHALAVLIVLV